MHFLEGKKHYKHRTVSSAPAPETASKQVTSGAKRLPTWVFITIASILVIFNYANQFIYRYAVPPGGDAVGHDAIVQSILAGHYDLIYRYHTFWHLAVIGLTRLFHIPSIMVMAWLAPFLLVTMGFVIYYFGQRYFGIVAGLTGAFVMVFLSRQPVQTLFDGSFPNVLAAGTILPLTVIALETIFSGKQKVRAVICFLIMLVLLTYSHHITTLYSLPIFALFLVLMFLKYLRAKGWPLPLLCGCLIALIFGGVALLIWLTHAPIPGSVPDLLKQFMSIDWHWPFIHFIGKLNDPNAMWPLTVYPNAIGEAVITLGLAGFIVSCWLALTQSHDKRWNIAIILCLWTLILAIGSQSPALGFPVRLARDLAVPLAILSGLFAQSMYNFITSRRLPIVFFYLFLLTIVALGSLTAIDRYKQAISPNPLIHHLAVDTAAATYITKKVPLSAPITVFQDDIYLKKFAPLHKVTWIESDDLAMQIAQAEAIHTVLPDNSYLYIESRHDHEESWRNNQGIVDRYIQLESAELVATFEQPEKKVYLFKILPEPRKK